MGNLVPGASYGQWEEIHILVTTVISSDRLEQLVSPVAFSSASNTILDPCAKETVLNALKESRKRAVEEEEEEDQNFPNGQENKKR